MLKRANLNACCKYSLVILTFDFEIYILKEGSGDNFPAGRQEKQIFYAADHWVRLII